jgi:hypothetical protein
MQGSQAARSELHVKTVFGNLSFRYRHRSGVVHQQVSFGYSCNSRSSGCSGCPTSENTIPRANAAPANAAIMPGVV